MDRRPIFPGYIASWEVEIWPQFGRAAPWGTGGNWNTTVHRRFLFSLEGCLPGNMVEAQELHQHSYPTLSRTCGPVEYPASR